MLQPTDFNKIRRIVDFIKAHTNRYNTDVELPDPDVQSPTESKIESEKQKRQELHHASVAKIGEVIYTSVQSNIGHVTCWDQLVESPPQRTYKIDTVYGVLYYGMTAENYSAKSLYDHIRKNLHCSTCARNSQTACILGPDGSMYLSWLNANPTTDLPPFPMGLIEGFFPEIISESTFGPHEFNGKHGLEPPTGQLFWKHLTVRQDVFSSRLAVKEWEKRRLALNEVRFFVDKLLTVQRTTLNDVLDLLDENNSTGSAIHLDLWADSVNWVRLILRTYDYLCGKYGSWATLSRGVRCSLYLFVLMETHCIVEESDVVLPVKKTAENFLDFLPSLLQKSEKELVLGANARMIGRFDSLAGQILDKRNLSHTNTIMIIWKKKVDLDLHAVIEMEGQTPHHISYRDKRDEWGELNIDDGICGEIGGVIENIGAENITLFLEKIPAGANMKVYVSLFAGFHNVPFELTIRMQNEKLVSSHVWDGYCSGNNLEKMMMVYSGPVRILQQSAELLYPDKLKKDMSRYGAEWIQAIGSTPRIKLATLEKFGGIIIKCKQDRNIHFDHNIPLTTEELFASVKPTKKLKINTLSEAILCGIQIRSTNFNPAVVTQIFADIDIFKPLYTQLSTHPDIEIKTSNSPAVVDKKHEETKTSSSPVATVAGVYLNGKSHAVLPGKNGHENDSASCLDNSWSVDPNHDRLIMNSSVTHIVPLHGGVLMLLSEGCRFPVSSQFQMSANCFPEVLSGKWHKCRRLFDYINHSVKPEDSIGTHMIGAWAGSRLRVWVQGKEYEVVNDLMF